MPMWHLSLVRIQVFLLCLLAGCSICWFNTVYYILHIQNFQTSQELAMSLTTSFNGLGAASYTLIAKAIDSDHPLYLLLNAFIPLLTSIIAFVVSIHRQSIIKSFPVDTDERESLIMFLLNILAAFTGLHLFILNTISYHALAAHVFFAVEENGCCKKLIEKDESPMHVEEHTVKMLVQSWGFWLYHVAYFCGGATGIVYSNNLGQFQNHLVMVQKLAPSLHSSPHARSSGTYHQLHQTTCIKNFPWQGMGGLQLAFLPLPMAFFLLAPSGSTMAFHVGTTLVALSSGFIFSVAVSIISEICGPKGLGINHNILITNIPLGSFFYGFLAAVIYDLNSKRSKEEVKMGEVMVCMGKQCYTHSFLLWGCFSLLGLTSSLLLFRRTRPVYDRLLIQRNQNWRQMFPMGIYSSSTDS
ncbi:Nodulin-like [Dillenia turbinata]|uniref:Nodulin-like n=1 Tax=Dillenia turbinata TaxID=194707 RepID=A0AAN8YYX0_9MAGN